MVASNLLPETRSRLRAQDVRLVTSLDQPCRMSKVKSQATGIDGQCMHFAVLCYMCVYNGRSSIDLEDAVVAGLNLIEALAWGTRNT